MNEFEGYNYLGIYAKPLHKPTREMLGRESEVKSIKSVLMRPELSNLILLGNAGSGKTAIVQKVMMEDLDRLYLEVDLSRMAESGENIMASRVKGLFDEIINYKAKNEQSREIVLFIDEFHQLVQLSPAAVEAIKPMLADSGTRGIKVIAATTYDEFMKYVSSNQPLVERLYRINIREPKKEVVINILRGMAETYGISDQIKNNDIFEQIYEYTERFIPANSQPRKSILLFDAMIGWQRAYGRKMDLSLIADVIAESEGVNVAFRVDPSDIEDRLNSKVFAQEYAVMMITRRLHVAISDLNDPTKPISSFLFSGSSGVGKTEVCKQLADILFGTKDSLIRFDMTEYSNPDTLERFREELTARVWQTPYSIVLLDEIEKAAPEITRLLLQVLDDARLINKDNREVSFKNCYIIMTTNAGSEVYKSIASYTDDTSRKQGMREFRKLIRRSLLGTEGGKFPPELYNRIDEVVPFAPLSNETLEKIVKNKIMTLKSMVRSKHGVNLKVSKNVIDYIIYENLDIGTDAGGARGKMQKFDTDVTAEVARYINLYPDEKRVAVVVQGEGIHGNKNKLISEAYIKVASY